MRPFLELWWMSRHNNTNISYEQLTENPPHRLLGVSRNEYLQSLDEFRLSETAANLLPEPEVLDWFRQHGDHYQHAVVTATSVTTAHVSAEWTFKHFGRWVRSFHLVPSARSGDQIEDCLNSKASFVKDLGVSAALVDDSEDTILQLDGTKISGVIFPRPWNKRRGSVLEALSSLEKLS